MVFNALFMIWFFPSRYCRFYSGKHDHAVLETNGRVFEFSIQGKTTVDKIGENRAGIRGVLKKQISLVLYESYNREEADEYLIPTYNISLFVSMRVL